MQFQSDILNTDVQRPKVTEVTALGAAYLAGLAVGYWGSLDEVADKAEIDRVFEPAQDETKRAQRYNGWKRAVRGVLSCFSRCGRITTLTTSGWHSIKVKGRLASLFSPEQRLQSCQ